MLDGQPSATAQRVAAHRLGFEWPPAPFGNPAAEDRLAADVAGPAGRAGSGRSERMARYLQARTAFFDRVVLYGLYRGAAQLLVIGAGYDGRALRYAKPGVRWFEVDHPGTQRDKQARLERLGIAAGHVTFVPADLREPGLADALITAGFEPDAPAPVMCEDVAAYLGPGEFRRLLAELRAVAAAGTRLAFSSALPAAAQQDRECFAAAAAALGEPVRSALT
jgi:methyltransferase (TIGR00027 family)